MKEKLRVIILLLIALLPSGVKIFCYNKFFGWKIHKSAKIGLSYINAKEVKIGANSKIKHLNIVRNLELFEMGDNSGLGHLNSVTALPAGSSKHFSHEKDRFPALIIGNHTGIVKGHFFDCSNKIEIANYSIVAGFGSAFFTHSINVENNKQETAPIYIGNYTMIGAKSVVTRGAVLPDCCILAANSTLYRAFEKQYTLYSGVPAKEMKELKESDQYFSRKIGLVD